MLYEQLMYIHLTLILPAFVIGTYLLLNRKGTANHRRLGKAYMLLMLISAIITLFMPAKVGPQLLNHFGLVHGLSFLVLYSVPAAYKAAKRHDVSAHKRNMINLYFGGLIIAGAFTFMPGRFLHTLIFG